MGIAHSSHGRPRGNTRVRPATSMGERRAEPDGVALQQPNGNKVPILSQSFSGKLQPRKMRKVVSQPFLGAHSQEEKDDVSALNRRMQNLSIQDKLAGQNAGRDQVIARQSSHPSAFSFEPEVKLGNITLRQSQRKEAARQDPVRTAEFPVASTPCPTTPPRHLEDEVVASISKVGSLLKDLRKTPISPTKFSSPAKRKLFLTKDSNVTLFTGWDMDERLHELDTQFKVIQEAMTSSLTDKKALEDAIDMAKSRGKLSFSS